MIDNVLKTQAFKLKGRFYSFTVLKLLSANLKLFETQLKELVAQAPKLFAQTPVVLDCETLEEETLHLAPFLRCMESHGLIPLGLQGSNAALSQAAREQHLPILHASANHDRAVDGLESLVSHAKLQTTPVRSGQQVVAKGADLIITAAVSHGAELLSDGNIHVYGALRGRALAGMSGDKHARIFCQSLDAELVAIAGFYQVSEGLKSHQGPCQIYLQDEHLCIDALG